MKEKRRFKRYNRQIPVRLVFESVAYESETVDYSFDGLCLSVKDAPSLEPGDIVDIDRTRTHVRGEYLVRWARLSEEATLLGLIRLGPLQGTLNDFQLSDVLIGLQRSRKSGTLHYKHGSVHKRVFFNRGDMVFAGSNQTTERLGEFFLSEGIITKEQFNKATEHLIQTKRRLGAVLVELAYIDLKTLYWGVKKQIENIILSLFLGEEGTLFFAEDELPASEVITLRLSAANLVVKGIKRIISIERIKELCPPADSVLELSTDPLNLFQDLRLDEDDKAILSLVDGMRSFKQIVTEAGNDILGTMKTINALMQTRVVKMRDESDTHHDEADADSGLSLSNLFLEDGGVLGLEEESTLEVLYKVEDLHEQYNNMTYYEFLGVPNDATTQMIRKAYYKKAIILHPDRHYHLPEDAKEKLDTLFTYLSTAYATLMDVDLRRSYDIGLADEGRLPASHNLEL